MLTLGIAVGSFVLYLVAYHTYGRWLARRLFKLDAAATVPAVALRDDKDFLPTRKSVLFGHHFTSIAGTGPIVGPALAVIWGWAPALLWVLFGSIFIGAVHDLGALVVSVRNRGETIGQVAGRLINPRAKLLFLLILFIALTIVLAIFGLVIASIFAMYPASVLTIWIEIPIAIAVGWLLYRRGMSPTIPAIVALAIMIGAIVLAVEYPKLQFAMPPIQIGGLTVGPVVIWTALLFVYCYIASTLPVWVLLQPRDYINCNKLVLSLVLLVGGIAAAVMFTEGGAPIVAPAVRASPPGAPPMMPFLFVTIACGAISGFHCLVSSGTTSKQIGCETDAQFVGYGSMLTEGFLAVLVILACCAGLGMGVDRAMPSGFWTNFDMFGSHRPTAAGLSFETDDGRVFGIAKNMINGQPELQEFKLEIDEFTDQPMTTWLLDHGLSAGEIVRFRQGRVTVVDSDTARLSGSLAWNNSYQSWRDADGLAKTVGSFVEGAGNFVAALGIPRPVAVALMAVLVASFAATTLDTATRLQRYVMQELAGTIGVRPLTTKHGATLFVVLVAAALAVVPPPGSSWSEGMGKGGLLLWPLFGAVNQLLAGLAFIVVAIYLVRRKLPTWMIVPPMVLMLVTPMLAMLYQILSGWGPLAGYDAGWLMRKQYHLVGAGIAVCGLEVWMVAEAMMLWPKVRGVIEREPTPLRGFPVQVVGDGD